MITYKKDCQKLFISLCLHKVFFLIQLWSLPFTRKCYVDVHVWQQLRRLRRGPCKARVIFQPKQISIFQADPNTICSNKIKVNWAMQHKKRKKQIQMLQRNKCNSTYTLAALTHSYLIFQTTIAVITHQVSIYLRGDLDMRCLVKKSVPYKKIEIIPFPNETGRKVILTAENLSSAEPSLGVVRMGLGCLGRHLALGKKFFLI